MIPHPYQPNIRQNYPKNDHFWTILGYFPHGCHIGLKSSEGASVCPLTGSFLPQTDVVMGCTTLKSFFDLRQSFLIYALMPFCHSLGAFLVHFDRALDQFWCHFGRLALFDPFSRYFDTFWRQFLLFWEYFDQTCRFVLFCVSAFWPNLYSCHFDGICEKFPPFWRDFDLLWIHLSQIHSRFGLFYSFWA